ncbi:MAG TPA: ribbon-helix-helix protein, CopG family [Methylomirabilota bacterium]|nr:ribbon-helix-helix protein, CopG family [Methylomirabilota bacterium]
MSKPYGKTIRISLTISEHLLGRLDKAAKQDYTSRSDIIRIALLWYLRPQGRELGQVDPDIILKTLKRRQAMAKLNKTIKETDRFVDIGDD